MKIYVEKFFPKTINDVNLLYFESLIKNTTEYREFYSEEGIFRIQNETLYRLIPVDEDIEYLEYRDKKFYIDKSKFIFKKDCFHIPYKHIGINLKKVEYKFNNRSLISMNIIFFNESKSYSSIQDIYFLTNEKFLDTNLKNEIHTFLSLFNNIK